MSLKEVWFIARRLVGVSRRTDITASPGHHFAGKERKEEGGRGGGVIKQQVDCVRERKR